MFAIPYIFLLIVIVISGQVADHIRAKKILSTTAVRKIQTAIGRMIFAISNWIDFVRTGGIGSSLCLALIGYVGCGHTETMFCITLAVAFIGFHASGCQISHLDIANNYAGLFRSTIFRRRKKFVAFLLRVGTLVGITNTLASIPGFVAPAMVGAITHNNVRELLFWLFFCLKRVIFPLN